MSAADCELPKAVVARIIKAALPDGVQVAKEAKEAVGLAAGLFILRLTSSANENCKSKQRSIISEDDVATALKDIEFEDFEEVILATVEAYKSEQAAKKSAKKSKDE